LLCSPFTAFFKTGKGEYGEGDLFLGIRVPEIRKLVVRFRDVPVLEIEKCLSSRYHEIRLFGFLSLAYRFKNADTELQKSLSDTYLRHKEFANNWDIVDTAAPNVIGAYYSPALSLFRNRRK